MNHPVLVIPEAVGCLRPERGSPISFQATWLARSILESEALSGLWSPGDSVPALWSGSYAQLEGGALFDEDPRTWGPKGWGALRSAIEAISSACPGVVIRPHANHVVSDAPGCRTLLEAAWARARNVRLLYDPSSMLTTSMLARGEDHLRRLYEAIELLPRESIVGVIVGPVGVLEGPRSGDLLMKLIAEHVPPDVPVVLTESRDSSGKS